MPTDWALLLLRFSTAMALLPSVVNVGCPVVGSMSQARGEAEVPTASSQPAEGA